MDIDTFESLSYDLVVVGGGVPGVCAAVAAARLGVRVALVQDRPVLGGNSSSEVRVVPKGAGRQNPWADETGIINELLVEDRALNHSRYSCNSMWDLILYDVVQREPRLILFLNTTIHSAIMEAPNRISAALGYQLTSERKLAFHARYFCDASGDGTLAAAAGAEYRHGREGEDEYGESMAPPTADQHTIPTSLTFISRDMGHPVPFKAPSWIVHFPSDESIGLLREHRSYERGYFWLAMGGLRHDTVRDSEEIHHELLRRLLGIWDHIKNGGNHGAENHALEWVATLPGKRESRRIMGDHVLSENEVRGRHLFPDRVAYGGWFLDLHAIGGMEAPHLPPEPRHGDPDWTEKLAVRPYSIPYRSLYSRNIRNLFMAGRLISATHVVHGSVRLINTGAVCGQAVGTAASMCLERDVDPCQLYPEHIHELQQLLLRQDCYIPGLRNEDPLDLARSAIVQASSQAALNFPDGKTLVELDWPCAQLFPIASGRLDAIELHLRSSLDQSVAVHVTLRDAPDVWTLAPGEPIATSECIVAPNSDGWVTVPLQAAVKSGRLYWIEVDTCPGLFWYYSNDKPAIPVGTTAARRRPGSTYWRLYESGDTTGCFALRTDPVQWPYGPQNTINGVARPESWTNIWVSDPQQPFPQDIELHWEKPVKLGTIQITFDTNVNISDRISMTPPLTRPAECVSDYELLFQEGDRWQPLLAEMGNYQRRRVHTFSSVETTAVRLRIHATNGAPSARVYEIRAYE